MLWNLRHGYIRSRYQYARGIGLDRRHALRHALSLGEQDIIAEAAAYIRP